MVQEDEEEQNSGKSVKIILEHFGSCEMKNKKMYCDLFNYVNNN